MYNDNSYSFLDLENVQKNYVELTNLCIGSMLKHLYAKKVVTKREKEIIETSRLQSDKMVYFLDSVIIPSLESKVTVKFKGFLEVMEGSDDLLLIDMAKKLCGMYINYSLYVTTV